MDGIDVLLGYFKSFKELEKEKKLIKEINKLIELLENAKNRSDKIIYILDYKMIEAIISKYDASNILNQLLLEVKNTYGVNQEDVKISDKVPNYLKDMINSASKGIDNVLYDVMLNVNRYNIYFLNKKTKIQNIPITADISFDELDVELKDIINYLEVNEEELDKRLLSDLNKFADVEKLKTMASQIKTDMGLARILFEKIEDKNVLLAIMLHSNINTIKSICDICEKRGLNINKLIGIPEVFIRNVINSKCKFYVPVCYDNFVNNIQICEKFGVDLKRMFNNHIVFLKNDIVSNNKLIEELLARKVNIKHVLENVGGIASIKPNVVLNNIDVLSLYGINLTDDNNNNGYTILGMENLAIQLDYHIEKGLWRKSYGQTLDNMDLTKGLRIKDGYLKWKNNYKCDTLDSTSLEKQKFTNEPYSKDKFNKVIEKYPEIKRIIDNLDNTYLIKEEGYYSIGVNVVSRLRVLRNLCNYKGKEQGLEIFFEALKHNSNINNSEEVIRTIKETLEVGDESVKLSKGL